MSRTIDEQVVSMQFDNKQFEHNVQTSLSTIDKLKQSLNFKGATKGLEGLDEASKKVNFSCISSAVETVGLKFNAMYTMADQAFRNIVNSAMAAGQRVISAFTMDPIKMGFAEYETQIGAVQTILANTSSKGTTLDDVSNALDILNKYADKTIYNFTEMTRNIGTFTAAGIDLDTSVTAIQGIANLAAISGSTSQQASTAMYQLSQALASGTVKLMDWNSVVNAGMGGQVFQDALKETARAHGIAIDDLIKKQGSFRESLQTGWLTSEILTETLAKFTMTTEGLTEAEIEKNREMLRGMGYTDEQIDRIFELGRTATDAATKVKTFTQLMDTLKEALQSGWTQSWELIIGNFEEAKELWTSISEVFGGIINASAEARNKLLDGALTSNWDKMTRTMNEAGVSTERFEDAVRKSAAVKGIDIDPIIKQYGSLKEAFRQGALSSDLLADALYRLKKPMADLSGVTRTLKKGMSGKDVTKVQKALKALGYDIGVDGKFGKQTKETIEAFQKAKGLKVTGVVDKETLAALAAATAGVDGLVAACAGFISEIDKLGGRELLIKAIKNIFEGLVSIVKPIKEAFSEIFPPMTVEQLYNAIQAFHNLSEKFKLSEDQAAKLKTAFKGIFSIIDIGWTFVKELAGGIFDLLGNFSGLGGGILDAASSLGEWITNLRDSIKENNTFGVVIGKITGFLQLIIDKVKAVKNFLSGKFSSPGFDGFYAVLNGILKIAVKIGRAIANVATSIVSAMGNAFDGGGFGSLIDIFSGGVFASILVGINKLIKKFTEASEKGPGLLGTIKDAINSLGESLQTWQQSLKADMILKIAGAIGILALSLVLIASINPDRLASSLLTITTLFGELIVALALFDKIRANGLKSSKGVGVMLGMAFAVLILASAVKKLADLDGESLAKGVLGIAGLMTIMVLAVKALSSEKANHVTKGAMQMVLFAFAVKILASAVSDLSSLSPEELAKGLIGVGVLLSEISLFLRTAKFSGKATSTALGIVILSAAIKILASACEDFSRMSWEDIGKGLAAIGVLLLELAAFTKLTGNGKKTVSTGLALVLIAASMKIFASAVSDFARMNWDEIGRGLAALAGALLAVAVTTRIMPKNMLGIGAGLLIVSAALLVLTDTLRNMGGMTWDEIGRGLAVLAGAMFILAAALNFMNGTLGGSASLIVAALALAILTPILQTLGSMSVESIVKGLLTLAGVFVILGVAGLLLTPLVPAILGLSVAIILLGAGVAAVGGGIALLAIGLTTLAASGAAVIGLIPVIIRELGNGVIEFLKVIAGSTDALGAAIKTIVLVLIDVLVSCVPAIADGALQLIVGLLDALVTYTPQIVTALFDFLIAIIDGLAVKLPELIQSVVNLLVALFTGAIDALGSFDTTTLLKAALGLGVMAALVVAASALAPFVPGALLGILGMAAVIAELALLIAAIGALAQIPGLTWLVGEGATLMKSIGSAIGGFVGSIIGGIAEGITDSLPAIGTNLSNFMTNLGPFLEGAAKLDSDMLDNVLTLVGIIAAITGVSLLEGITSFITGTSSIDSFATQLDSLGKAIVSFSDTVSGISEDDATQIGVVATAAGSLVDIANKVPKKGGLAQAIAGTPDLVSFANGVKELGTSIQTFTTSVSEVTEDDLTKMSSIATAAESLVTLSGSVPKKGGLAQAIAGAPDLATFALEMKTFGENIVSFTTSVANITEDDLTRMTNIASAASTLVGVASSLSSYNDSTIFNTNLTEFAGELATFGEKAKGFADSTAGADFSNASSVSFLASRFTTIASSLSGVDTNCIEDLGDDIKYFGDKASEFYTTISGIDTTKLSSITTSLVSLSGLSGDSSGLTKFIDSMAGISTSGINSFLDSVTDSSTKFAQAGGDMIVTFIEGVTSKAEALLSTFRRMLLVSITTIKSNYLGFESAGKYVVQGFAAGITANTFLAKAKAVLMAKAAKKAAEAALGIKSPSRVFYKIGAFTGEGFVNALGDYESKTYKAGRGIAESARIGLSDAISRVMDTINSDMDAQPTIRPVLDLTDVEQGIGSIGGMFGGASIGVRSNLGAINSMMNNQNGANSDVVSAIEDLGRAIGNRSGDVYNVNGITYDDGSNITDAVRTLVRAARVERRT